jgi:predicted DNA-binding transcriptional regulator AlpA
MSEILLMTEERLNHLLDKKMNDFFKKVSTLINEKDNKENDVIGITEAAILAGLSKNTIYQYSSRNQIPKLAGKTKKLLFSRTELLAWLNADRPKILEKAINELLEKQSPNQLDR